VISLGEALRELHDELLVEAARERIRFFARMARRFDSPEVERRLIRAYDDLIKREA
jgi:hypothetical protein